MTKNIKIKKILFFSSIIFFITSTIFYYLSSENPFLYLYNNGLDKLLLTIIESESISRINDLIIVMDQKFFKIIFGLYFFLLMLFSLYNSKKIIFSNKFYDFFKLDELRFKSLNSNIYILIALAAGLGLFLELAIIRIHSSYFQLFAYFKNLSLLSCFLGLGIGYSFSKLKLYSLNWTFPLISFQVSFMYLLKDTPITLFFQNPVSEIWNMGQSIAIGALHITLIYIFIALIFLFNALAFIPLGHLVARLMKNADVLKAYSYDLLGAIGGILFFSFLSFLWTNPIVWLTVSFSVMIFFQFNLRLNIKFSCFTFVLMILCLNIFNDTDKLDLHSPYQNISIKFNRDQTGPLTVQSNNIWLQTPLNLSTKMNQEKQAQWHKFYIIPFTTTPKDFSDILIVGSGTGNDVATALRYSNAKIDAVEIDPLVADIGVKFHPENPYANPRVKLIINDARNFIKETKKKYDLIVYSVLDSHANLSSKGGVRLDSYVYTVESFYEARKKLNDDGIMFLSFALSTPQMGNKIYEMLKVNFDINPKVLTRNNNSSDQDFKEGIYSFVVSNKNLELDLSDSNYIESNLFKDKNLYKNVDVSTDDWPFFYMSYRIYPASYVVLIFVIFIISLLFLKNFTKISLSNFSYPSFFLGIGFMLMETKAITELAKIYGSTWFVVSIVITTILFMAYLANVFVIKKVKISINQIYFLLVVSLFASYFFTFVNFYNYPTSVLKIIIPIILLFPVFFSGLAFSKELVRYGSTANALACNIMGAIVGGLLEYNSMYFGFKFLYLLAIFFYIIAYISSIKFRF